VIDHIVDADHPLTELPTYHRPTTTSSPSTSARSVSQTPRIRESADGKHRRTLTRSTVVGASECPGSLTAALLSDAQADVAACPFCGARLPVGYGGRLPVHEPLDPTFSPSRRSPPRPSSPPGPSEAREAG
jgi:hypothetical protein